MAGHGGEHGACALCGGQASYVAFVCFGACCSLHVNYTPVQSDMRSSSWALLQLPALYFAWLVVVLLAGTSIAALHCLQWVSGPASAACTTHSALQAVLVSAAGCDAAASACNQSALADGSKPGQPACAAVRSDAGKGLPGPIIYRSACRQAQTRDGTPWHLSDKRERCCLQQADHLMLCWRRRRRGWMANPLR